MRKAKWVLLAVSIVSLLATLVFHSKAYRLTLIDRSGKTDMSYLRQHVPSEVLKNGGPWLLFGRRADGTLGAAWGELVIKNDQLLWYPYKDFYYSLSNCQEIAVTCLVLSLGGLFVVMIVSHRRKKRAQQITFS